MSGKRTSTATPGGLPPQVDFDCWPVLRQSLETLVGQVAAGDHDGRLRQLYTMERAHFGRVTLLQALEERIAALGG